MSYKRVTLQSINSGAALDLFDEELKKVLMNIADENTVPDAKREIKLTLKIIPSRTRDSASTQITVTSKLATLRPHAANIVIGFNGSRVEAFTSDVNQEDLPFEKTDLNRFKEKEAIND